QKDDVDLGAAQALLAAADRLLEIARLETLHDAFGSSRAGPGSERSHLRNDEGPWFVRYPSAECALHRAAAVNVGSLERGDAQRERTIHHAILFHELHRAVRIAREAPGAERQLGNGQARFAEGTRAHDGDLARLGPLAYGSADRC